MNQRVVRGLFLLAGFMAAAAAGANPSKVDSIDMNGQTVWRTSDIPAELEGEYLYEKKGEPIIRLSRDGTGLFQPHGVPAIPIRFWLMSDEKGEPVKQTGGINYRYTVILEYGPGGGGNYPQGGIGSWYWTRDNEAGCSNILGERFKCD